MFCLLALPLDHKDSCKNGRERAGCGVSDFSASTQKCRKYLAFTSSACSFLAGRKLPISSSPTVLHTRARALALVLYKPPHPLLQYAKVKQHTMQPYGRQVVSVSVLYSFQAFAYFPSFSAYEKRGCFLTHSPY